MTSVLDSGAATHKQDLRQRRGYALACYSVRLNTRWRPEDHLPVASFGTNSDLLEVARAALDAIAKETTEIPTAGQWIQTSRLMPDGRTLAGIIESGGREGAARLFNTVTREDTYRRSVNDADLRPFYFQLHVPKDQDATEAWAVVQRTGQAGVTEPLREYLRSWFSTYHDDVVIKFEPIAPQRLIDELTSGGRIRTLRFIRYRPRPDVADQLTHGADEQEFGSIELVVRARRNSTLPVLDAIKRVFKREASPDSLLRFTETQFQHDEVKAELVRGGRIRTINFGRLDSFAPTIDISDDVQFDADTGHPQFDSIHALASGIIVELNGSPGPH